MESLVKSIAELGKIRKYPQLLYYAPINGMGTIKLREAILEYKKTNPDKSPLDFILNSPGGSADDAYRIIRMLRKNFDPLNIVIPFWAKSAATLLSLGATTIIMDEFGEFGALDVQLPKQQDDSPYVEEAESALIDEISLETIEKRSHRYFLELFISMYTNKYIPINKNDIANDVFHYLSKFYEPLLRQINPYKIGDKKRKLDIGAQYAKRILTQYNPSISSKERKEFIDYLVNDCPDHGYVVDYDLLKPFLKNVIQATDLDKDFKGYSNKLAEVSLYLLNADHEKERCIGFIDEKLIPKLEKSPESKKPPVPKKKKLLVPSNGQQNGHQNGKTTKAKSKKNGQKAPELLT